MDEWIDWLGQAEGMEMINSLESRHTTYIVDT
jgi:hypothetical protein